MSSKEYFNLYSQFLASYCGCYPDSEGNRPCDNGLLCDRCMTKEAQEIWQKMKRGSLIN